MRYDPSTLSDEFYALADAAVEVMRAKPGETWTGSMLGRKIHCPSWEANQVLEYLAEQQYAQRYGNGAWSRVGLR